MTWLPEWGNWFEAINAIVELLAGLVVVLGIPFAALKFFRQRREDAERQSRETAERHAESLRLGEVTHWGHRGIDVLQRIVLLTAPSRSSHASDSAKLDDLAIEASVLTEQGRTWFINRTDSDVGTHKPLAYQGLRPLILDYLVAGYEAAVAWQLADPAERSRINNAVIRAEQQFVSLLQRETARLHTKAEETAQPGYDAPLRRLLSGALK